MAGSNIRELGQVLREAREQKRVSLAEAQQATKIRQTFLQALEQENYEILPPPVYIRGFLKTYATYLGLNPHEVVQAFDELMNALETGIELYQASPNTERSGADSGGLGLYNIAGTENLDPRSLAGLTEGEVNLLANTSSFYKITAERSEEAPGGTSDNPPESNINHSQLPSLSNRQKYVLRPAMQPLNKTSYYIPNFMPILAVVILVAAALLLLFRGFSSSGNSAKPTSTAISVPTIATTVAISADVGKADTVIVAPAAIQMPTPKVTTPIAPDPTILAAIAAGTTVQQSQNTSTKASTALPTTTAIATATPTPPPATATPTPAIVYPPVKLTLEVKESSWVQVWVDSKQALNELVGNKTLNFEGVDKVEVALGKPGGVRILVNDQEKAYAPPGSGVVVKTFKSDGTEEISKR